MGRIPHIFSALTRGREEALTEDAQFRDTESTQHRHQAAPCVSRGFCLLCFVPPLLGNWKWCNFHGARACCMSLDSAKSRLGTDSLRNRKRRGSRRIETTCWGAIVKYQRGVVPQRGADGIRLTKPCFWSDSAGSYALILYSCVKQGVLTQSIQV